MHDNVYPSWVVVHAQTHTHAAGLRQIGIWLGLEPLSFNHDQIKFAPASWSKAAFPRLSIDSADEADLGGRLIRGCCLQ